jgi:glycosyltransferase involved in cell wall biosynthesis
MTPPGLSVIVVFRDMAREAPRTLFTLSKAYQRGVDPSAYEVIAVDAGSAVPLDAALIAALVNAGGPRFTLLRTPPSPSPSAAINEAVRRSTGAAVMVCIDGARMLTPGVVRFTLDAFQAWNDPLVATLAWHLGPKIQNESMLEGYDQAVEDRLLESVDWRVDGYELFRISAFAGSSRRGWFLPLSESNGVAVRRETFDRLGGFDEGFQTAGGGLVNLDFHRRACASASEVVHLLGEGTFHQFHGGVATNVPAARHPFPIFHEEYVRLRGEPFAPPTALPLLLGGMPPQALPFLERSLAELRAASGA